MTAAHRVADSDGVTLRDPIPGDMGWVVERHGTIYHEMRGWDTTFEALVAKIASEYVTDFDPRYDRGWIAMVDGRRAGSIFLTRYKGDPTTGQLRMLLVEPWARGRGIGSMLVDACVEQARANGYAKMILFTSKGLDSARRLYEAVGFELTREKEESVWGSTHTAQWWEVEL